MNLPRNISLVFNMIEIAVEKGEIAGYQQSSFTTMFPKRFSYGHFNSRFVENG